MSTIREAKTKKFLPMFERYEPIMQDHSAMKEFKRCPRRYFYRIVLGFTPKDQERKHILDFGTAYHKFRELINHEWFHGNRDWPDILSKSLNPAIATYKPDLSRASEDDKFLYSIDRLMECCFVAFEHVKKEKQEGKFNVIAYEQPFNVVMPDGSITGGRADEIVQWGGRLWDRDFKSTTKKPEWFIKDYNPHDQPTRYIYGIGVFHGKPLGGAIFELLVNDKGTKAKPGKPYIKPEIITRTTWQLEQWERDQIFINQYLDLCRENDHWPMQENNCSWCEFQPVCKKTNELSLAMELKQKYALKPWKMQEVEQKEIK